jgi:hypothetical protein
MDLNTAPLYIINEEGIECGFDECVLWLGTQPLLSTDENVTMAHLTTLAQGIFAAQHTAGIPRATALFTLPVCTPSLAALAAVVQDDKVITEEYDALQHASEDQLQAIINDYTYSDTDCLRALLLEHGCLNTALAAADVLVIPYE